VTRSLTAAGLLLLGLVLGLGLARGGGAAFGGSKTRVDERAVVERLQSVAKLTTTEATVRDVLSYQNTRYGSTKRSLVIVTGTAMIGLDLASAPRVHIDDQTRTISISLPHARLLSVDVSELKTYDESRGLWNPFHPADRDTIFILARARLMHAAQDMAVMDHAEQGARQLFTSLFAPQGYSVDVVFEPFLQQPLPE
jgi:hypothetical protein